MVRIRRMLAAFFVCTMIALLALPVNVHAYSPEIKDIVVYVELNRDGSADVTEIWDVTVASGTEWYLVQGNLGDIEIQDFSVMDENGTVFENEGYYWDIDRSIEEKKEKCGIVDNGGGNYELCWGVGSYGSHVYTVNYHMTNFVKGFDDYCAFNQRLINDQLSSEPQEIHVMITKPGTELTTEEVGVWAFGFEGSIYVNEGVVEANSSEALSSDDYVTVMCRFPRDMFDTNSIITGTFDEMKEEAFRGSSYSSDTADDGEHYISLFFGFFGVVIIVFILFTTRHASKLKIGKPTTFEEERIKWNGKEEKKFYKKPAFWIIGCILLVVSPLFLIFYIIWICTENKKEVGKVSPNLYGPAYPAAYMMQEMTKTTDYYRDIPLEGSIPVYYAIGKLTRKTEDNNNIIGAYLLKWLQEGKIEIRNERKSGLGGSLGKEEPSIILKTEPYDPDFALERMLFDQLRVASGGDNILQEKELYRWSKQNYTKVTNLLKKFDEYGKAYLENHEYMGSIPSPKLFGVIVGPQEVFTESGREQLLAVKRLCNFLKDFTIINERPPEDVMLWDKYMIAAQMFGMADKVAEKFRKIYPDYFENHATYYNNYASSYIIINSISRASTSGVHAASSSSGGGGFSSSGGGGGFSGGGSGGGSR